MFALPELYHRQFESTLLTITHLPETHYGVIWARVIEMIKDHPVFGIGVHHYRTVCLDPIYGPLLAGPQHNLQPCALHPHNTYLEWFVETGTVGLALYLAFAVCVFRALAQSFAAHKKDFLYIGLMLAVGMRFWPLASTPSFHIAWAVMSFWLLLGWSLSYTPKRTP